MQPLATAMKKFWETKKSKFCQMILNVSSMNVAKNRWEQDQRGPTVVADNILVSTH